MVVALVCGDVISADRQIPGLAPYTPITSVLPLVFVISVSAVKQAYEDYQVKSLTVATYDCSVTWQIKKSIYEQLMCCALMAI
jgi:hypothetical protein